jgi:hypothetical protein
MSSSRDVGGYTKDNYKIEQSKCKKTTNEKHVWIEKGSWPSTWRECEACKKAVFDK